VSVSLSLRNLVYTRLRSIHRGSITTLDEWLLRLPPPFDEESEQEEEEEIEEVEAPQQPEIPEVLEQDEAEPEPPTGSIAEPIEPTEPQPIQVPSDTEDFEYHATPPPQEPELHEDIPSPKLAPIEVIARTPTAVIEEVRPASPVFDFQLPPPTPPSHSPAPVTPKLEEDQDIVVDVMNISDDEGAQSSDSQNDIFPRTPSPTIPNTIDTALLYRGPDQPIIVAPPSPAHDPQYNFDEEFAFDSVKPPAKDGLPYTLPLLNSLPPEFRKKNTRTQRKREKERERTEVRKDREDWTPMGMAKWRALLRANPTWQHLARSTKSLTTKDWNVSLDRVLDFHKFSAPTRLL